MVVGTVGLCYNRPVTPLIRACRPAVGGDALGPGGARGAISPLDTKENGWACLPAGRPGGSNGNGRTEDARTELKLRPYIPIATFPVGGRCR
jgi:hypothetical protein